MKIDVPDAAGGVVDVVVIVINAVVVVRVFVVVRIPTGGACD